MESCTVQKVREKFAIIQVGKLYSFPTKRSFLLNRLKIQDRW